MIQENIIAELRDSAIKITIDVQFQGVHLNLVFGGLTTENTRVTDESRQDIMFHEI